MNRPATAPITSTVPAGSLRGRQKIATRRAISDAALELFAEVGYEAASVGQITKRAGVSERTFFLHFPSKEDVLFGMPIQDYDGFTAIVAGIAKNLSDFR